MPLGLRDEWPSSNAPCQDRTSPSIPRFVTDTAKEGIVGDSGSTAVVGALEKGSTASTPAQADGAS